MSNYGYSTKQEQDVTSTEAVTIIDDIDGDTA
jgi:hypothetical protein